MFRFYAPIIYGVTDGVLGTLEGAATGAAGAAILSTAGYDYDIADAAKVGALGRGVLSAYFSARSIKLAGCGFFRNHASQQFFSFGNAFLSSSYLGLQVLSGMLGEVIIRVCDNTQVEVSETSRVMALGAAAILVPVWLIDTYLYDHIAPTLQRCGDTLKILDQVDEFSDTNVLERQHR